ncbi:LysR family transcriptional regulator [Shewanella aegiceratis]|uniref:LysR family transcriptional regulator n=1 Tax=Shewanella aegiceratis TaxID=2864203 RepID=UPI001C654B04|nr:LysR family transcriptional regulator [Shewanella aegiceratis]QYJ82043.1 LysR family transcriptional regulator [Shewanella aegiceratis]
MDLNRIQMFAQVVDKGSFTSAAKAMGLTKATVSRKIAELETDTGVQLLYRTTRALKLTEAGSIYYNKIQRILMDLQSAEDQLSASQETIKGNLKIVCPIELGQLFFGRIFARFLEAHPEMTLDAELTNRKVDMIEEGIDILFQVSDVRDSRLQSYRVLNTDKSLVASPDYLARHGTPATPQDLIDHKAIRLKSTHIDGGWTLFDGQQWITIEPEAQLTVNNVTLAREAAIEGLGIATAPTLVAQAAIEEGLLIPLLTDFPMAQTAITLSFPRRAYLPRKYRAFIEYIYLSLFDRRPGEILEIPDFITPPQR